MLVRTKIFGGLWYAAVAISSLSVFIIGDDIWATADITVYDTKCMI
jgi:hypothetical protein